ncbi:hypothetical protein FOPE_12471 [Fonsecaea pedrosoi]|nr:hypothetical protein FOPE_12471 [Fonsecaea pedrosoi]
MSAGAFDGKTAVRVVRCRISLQSSRLALVKPQSLDLPFLALAHLLADIESRPSSVQLALEAPTRGALDLPPTPVATLEFQAGGNGRVASESFSHVHQSAPAFAEPDLELLALLREGLEQRVGEALEGGVSLDEDAVAVLEALGQRITCRPGRRGVSHRFIHFAGKGEEQQCSERKFVRRGGLQQNVQWWRDKDVRISLHEDGIFGVKGVR